MVPDWHPAQRIHLVHHADVAQAVMLPEDAVSRTVDPSWLQLVDTAKIRGQLEFKPNYPSLYRALNEGAL